MISIDFFNCTHEHWQINLDYIYNQNCTSMSLSRRISQVKESSNLRNPKQITDIFIVFIMTYKIFIPGEKITM